jgi:hypothetical protein
LKGGECPANPASQSARREQDAPGEVRDGEERRRWRWRSAVVLAQADGLIEQWETEGASQKAFCEARGVAVSSFRWWKWKLGVEGYSSCGEGSGRGELRRRDRNSCRCGS